MTISIGGGLGEEYMSAPRLQVGGGDSKGGGGFIAGLLDLLGVHRQVAKEPKEGKGEKKEAAGPESGNGKTIDAKGGAPAYTPGLNGDVQAASSAPPPSGISLSVLDQAEAAFDPLTPKASKFGNSFTFLPMGLR